MEERDKKALKHCIRIARSNHHIEFLSHLNSFKPPDLSSRMNEKTSLKLFIIRTVVGQQVSVKAADATWKKVKPIVNKRTLKKSELKDIGLSQMKQEYVWGIFNSFSKRKISKKYLRNCSINELEDIFLCIKGIGPWTLNIIRMFYIGDEDIWLPEDLAIKKSAMHFFKEQDLNHIQSLYKPYRTYFCLYLWAGMKLIK